LIMIAENINFLQRAYVSLQRIFTILEMKTEKEVRDDKGLLPSFQEKIEFKNIWFQYKENEWVLRDVSFDVKKGEKIALVGASGSGKSTTISLLCGFYNINKGDILIDGKKIEDLDLHKWRKKIGLVLQDIYLFPGNILENVRIYNDEINDEQVENAVDSVHAREFISKREDGILTELKERGQNLSSGEKQLISFARAVAAAPEIIIMDEATASVDAKTESKIQESMQEMLKGRTAFIVAHRLVSVLNADKILLFQNGKIIAAGTHSELLEISPEYQKLVELQFLKKEETLAV